MATVEWQLSIEYCASDAKGLQKQPQAIALVDAVDEEQDLALYQAQLQQHHDMQHLVFPAGTAMKQW